MRSLLNRLIHIGDWLSAGLNAIFLGGCNQESTSGRSYREVVFEGNSKWRTSLKVIDWFFSPFEKDHCKNAYYKDLARAESYQTRHEHYMSKKVNSSSHLA